MNRREFLILAVVAVAGCSSTPPGAVSSVQKTRMVNAGPAGQYAADGVYSRFRALGFFIIRRGDKLFVLSSICTHRHCLVGVEPDRSFLCPCHGSTFTPEGQVTHGPAKRNLPTLETFIDENSDLLVRLPTT